MTDFVGTPGDGRLRNLAFLELQAIELLAQGLSSGLKLADFVGRLGPCILHRRLLLVTLIFHLLSHRSSGGLELDLFAGAHRNPLLFPVIGLVVVVHKFFEKISDLGLDIADLGFRLKAGIRHQDQYPPNLGSSQRCLCLVKC